VIALIFALRWLSQRLFGKVVASRSSRAVQILSRNVISPKQQLLVLQVGRRLVVVGDSGQQMNPLCEITDPDEMAALIGQIREEKRESTPAAFGAIFGRAGSAFEKENHEPQRPVDVAGEDDDSADNSSGPPSVQDTRDELSGLMDKVRLMSRQFPRT
jgi:flagellar biogenesis protein FliO